MILPFKFIIDPKNCRNLYYVYTVSDGTKILYIGVSDVANLMCISDALLHHKIRAKILEYPYVLIDVIGSYEKLHEARTAAHELVYKHKPWCNQYGIATLTRKKRVRCVETGVIYKSVTDAAKAANCALSAMSNHLHKRKGYSTLKKRTYEFAE